MAGYWTRREQREGGEAETESPPAVKARAKPARKPLPSSNARDVTVTREGGRVIDAHGLAGYYVACACGCGEDVYVPIRPQFAGPAHKQRAYRQRRKQGASP